MLVKVFEQIKYLQICDAEFEKSDGEKTAFAHKRDAYIMSSAAEEAATESCFHAIRLDFDGEKRAAASSA